MTPDEVHALKVDPMKVVDQVSLGDKVEKLGFLDDMVTFLPEMMVDLSVTV